MPLSVFEIVRRMAVGLTQGEEGRGVTRDLMNVSNPTFYKVFCPFRVILTSGLPSCSTSRSHPESCDDICRRCVTGRKAKLRLLVFHAMMKA